MILIERRLAAAEKHRSEGRNENALAIYQEILDISPSNGEALRGLGQVLLRLGRLEEAADIAARAVSVAPSDLDALTLYAGAAHATGHLDKLAMALDQAAAIDPLHPETVCLRAERLQSAGDMAGAERILVDALRAHPDNVALLCALSQIYSISGLVEDALELSSKAVQIDPGASAHLILLGSQMSAIGDPARALELFEQASLLDPANILSMILMADAHAALGQLTEASRLAKRAVGLRSDQLAAHRVLTRIRIQQGEADEALRELTEIIRRHTDKIEALITLSDAYRQAGQHAQALHLIEPLVARSAELKLPQRQAVLAIARESRLSLGRIDAINSLVLQAGGGGLRSESTGSGESRDVKVGALSEADRARLASLPLLIADHTSMLEALPLLRFRLPSAAGEPLLLVGPPAFTELAALLPGTNFRAVEGSRPVPGVDGFPLQSILALPADVRGPLQISSPYIVAPEDRRAIWRGSLADLPRPWLAISWNAQRPGLMLGELLSLLAGFKGSLISVVWDDSRHQLAAAPHIIDAGIHCQDLADVAAILAEVDAVVGPDGLALHMAGAMQRRCAVMVQPNAPWYWCERDGRALWYPSVSILRTSAIGHWSVRSEDLKDDLTDFLSDLEMPDEMGRERPGGEIGIRLEGAL